MYNGVSDSDDSTIGSNNNCAILQHNKGRITVKNDEEKDLQEDDMSEEDKEEDERGEYPCGKELKTAIISMVKNLI